MRTHRARAGQALRPSAIRRRSCGARVGRQVRRRDSAVPDGEDHRADRRAGLRSLAGRVADALRRPASAAVLAARGVDSPGADGDGGRDADSDHGQGQDPARLHLDVPHRGGGAVPSQRRPQRRDAAASAGSDDRHAADRRLFGLQSGDHATRPATCGNTKGPGLVEGSSIAPSTKDSNNGSHRLGRGPTPGATSSRRCRPSQNWPAR